jgi:radical SAM protein with 4Fe4S-binding SPASM domain
MNKVLPHLLLEKKAKIREVIRGIQGILSYDPARKKTKMSGPSLVQIQTMDQCNASCVMCPYSYDNKDGRPNRMEAGLYSHILDELKQAGTVRTFSPMLQNEPLMDPCIDRRVGEAKEVMGSSTAVHLVTNGSLLNSACVEDLLKAGLDILSVSIDAVKEETYTSIHRGLKFSKVIKNLESLLKRNPRIIVVARFLKQKANEGEEKNFRQHWKSMGARVLIKSAVNRAGMLDPFNQIKRKESGEVRHFFNDMLDKFFPFCPMPFYTMNVLWNGRVILCCHDWGHAVVVGDLSKQSLPEVWNGKAINYYRHLLYNLHSEEIPSCSRCSFKNGFFSQNV